MADILFVIICMANSMGIDLEDAFTRMMEKYRLRDSERWTKIVVRDSMFDIRDEE